MAQNDKICIELAFNKSISHSQQIKVKDFWKFMNDTKPLKPFEIKPGKPAKKEKHERPKCERKWYNQLKVFQEVGLDKAALATSAECKLCYDHFNHMCTEISNTVEDPYDELINDMKAFDEKLNGKEDSKLTRKRSSISCTDHFHQN